jgi:cation transporter-like permease
MHEGLKHWPHLYRRRRERALGISAKQMAISQVFSLAGSIIAGLLLEQNKAGIAALAGAFVILPGVFDLDGSLGAALSARINHALEETDKALKVFVSSIGSAMIHACLAGILVASVGAGVATVLFQADFMSVFSLGIGAIILSGVIGFPLIGALSVYFRRKKINPDDVVGPIESSLFDILTVISVAVLAGLLV